MSRRFYMLAKADPKTPLELCNRTVEQLAKYGVDLDDPDTFSFSFNGDIVVNNLLFDQCKSVMRIIYNGMLTITEIGEDIEGVSFVIYARENGRTPGLSQIYDAMDDWVEIDAETILDEYLEDSEDEDEEEAEDEDEDPGEEPEGGSDEAD